MTYLVIEIQKNADGTVGNFVWAYTSINEAESKFHSVLAYAAVSTVQVHSCALLNESGYCIKSQSYTHLPEPTPEPENEAEE